MPSKTWTLPDIHQHTAHVWYNVTLPTAGQRLLVDTDGVPTAGAPVYMGAIEGVTKITLKRTIQEIGADQFTAPIDMVMTADDAEIACSLKESQLAKISYVLGPTYATGTDAGLPAGAQAYEEIAQGGLVVIPTAPVAVISARRGYTAPGKHFVFILYKAYGIASFEHSYTRTATSNWAAHWKGLAITTRAEGDQVSKLYRQT